MSKFYEQLERDGIMKQTSSEPDKPNYKNIVIFGFIVLILILAIFIF